MRKTHDTKTRWNGWIDTDILTKIKAIAEERKISSNTLIEEILSKYLSKLR